DRSFCSVLLRATQPFQYRAFTGLPLSRKRLRPRVLEARQEHARAPYLERVPPARARIRPGFGLNAVRVSLGNAYDFRRHVLVLSLRVIRRADRGGRGTSTVRFPAVRSSSSCSAAGAKNGTTFGPRR